MQKEWDFIVVGAGSSGCVVARRLSDNPSVRVLLLEAGPAPKSFWIDTPAGMASLFLSDKYNWRYHTEPVAQLNNRRIYWPRGKVLGGSSAINGMVYTRGNKKDYDYWADLGNGGWSWSDVLPYFKKAEDNQRGGNAFRGEGGPLCVSDPVIEHRSVSAFIEAAHDYGIQKTHDLSTCGDDGVGVLQATIRHGKRHSAYDAYIKPIEHRSNLDIRTETSVQKILFHERRATGVEILQGKQIVSLHARKEVIVCAGALASPQLLMLSGIGNSPDLQRHGIQPLIHLPGVGQNLQDHCSIHIKVETQRKASYNLSLRGWRKYLEGLKYLTTKHSYLALGSSQAAAFIKSRNDIEYSDLEVSFRPMTFSFNDNGAATVDAENAISASIYRVRPASRGFMALQDANPHSPPLFSPNYLEQKEDQDAMVNGVKMVREIFKQRPLALSIRSELAPGPSVSTDEQILQFIKANAKCAYHPVGTCKMGQDDMAVVDARLRLRGIDGLRVIDASIMPVITSGNTNAPSIMIGEKGAAMVMEDIRHHI